MHYAPSLPSYTEIADAFSQAKVNFHPAQVHGLCCGYICATSGDETTSDYWKKILPDGKENHACRELLQQIYETTYHQISEFSFEFALLLPGDDIDINARTEALGLWCQGFLTGLEQAKVPLQNREDNEVTEALNDIIEIAQVNYGDISDNEEDETAYFELIEYVRLSALMIFHELKTASASNNTDEDNQLQ